MLKINYFLINRKFQKFQCLLPSPSLYFYNSKWNRHKTKFFFAFSREEKAMRLKIVFKIRTQEEKKWLKEKRMKERNTWSRKNVAESSFLIRWSICSWKFLEMSQSERGSSQQSCVSGRRIDVHLLILCKAFTKASNLVYRFSVSFERFVEWSPTHAQRPH